MTKKQLGWREKTIIRLTLYPLQAARTEVLKIRGNEIPQELINSNNEVCHVVNQLSQIEQKIVQSRYFKLHTKDSEVMKQLYLSSSYYYTVRNKALLKAAKLFCFLLI